MAIVRLTISWRNFFNKKKKKNTSRYTERESQIKINWMNENWEFIVCLTTAFASSSFLISNEINLTIYPSIYLSFIVLVEIRDPHIRKSQFSFVEIQFLSICKMMVFMRNYAGYCAGIIMNIEWFEEFSELSVSFLILLIYTNQSLSQK